MFFVMTIQVYYWRGSLFADYQIHKICKVTDGKKFIEQINNIFFRILLKVDYFFTFSLWIYLLYLYFEFQLYTSIGSATFKICFLGVGALREGGTRVVKNYFFLTFSQWIYLLYLYFEFQPSMSNGRATFTIWYF